jgi:hypothetical protein
MQKEKEKFVTLLTLEEKESLVSILEKELVEREESCPVPTIENLPFFTEDFVLEALRNQVRKLESKEAVYDDEYCKLCKKLEDCPFAIPNPVAKDCPRKNPSQTNEEIRKTLFELRARRNYGRALIFSKRRK